MKLTHLLPVADREEIGELSVSPIAESYVSAELEMTFPAEKVAASAASFLKCLYFVRSGWFRAQKVHTFPAICYGGDNYIVLRIQKESDGYQIRAGVEVELPENYYEQRVVEEVISES